MRILGYCYIFLLNCVYVFLKLLPQKPKKILLMSRQSDKMSLDFRLLTEEISRRNGGYEIVVLTRRIEKNIFSVFTKEFFYIYRQMYHLATAKVCVIDGYNIPISVLKHRKSLEIVQIWHALGAIKKFGLQAKHLDQHGHFSAPEVFRMHKNYDVILSPSSATTKIYKKAFGYNSDKNFTEGLLPRVDYLTKGQAAVKRRFCAQFPKLKDKKLILYAPTFREDGEANFAKIMENLPDDCVLMPKVHARNAAAGEEFATGTNADKVINVSDFSALQLLAVADAVITDYSAITFEAMVVGLPVYFYVFDIETYRKSPGFNIDVSQKLPKACFVDAKDLFDAVEKGNAKYDWHGYERFRRSYLGDDFAEGGHTKALADRVLELL